MWNWSPSPQLPYRAGGIYRPIRGAFVPFNIKGMRLDFAGQPCREVAASTGKCQAAETIKSHQVQLSSLDAPSAFAPLQTVMIPQSGRSVPAISQAAKRHRLKLSETCLYRRGLRIDACLNGHNDLLDLS